MQQYQRYTVYFFKSLFAVAIGLFLYVFVKGLFSYVLPFIIAWAIALLINPAVNFVQNRTKLPRALISVVFILTFYALLTFLLILGATRLIVELSNILDHLPRYAVTLKAATEAMVSRGQNIYINLPPETTDLVRSSIMNLINSLTSTISTAIAKSMSLLTFLPRTVIFIIITIISSYMMSKDLYEIRSFFASQISETLLARIKSVCIDLVKALEGFIRTQLTIMSITFLIAIVSLYLMNIPYALTMAIIIGIVDALPIIGPGSVLIPWAAINLFTNNYPLAIALLILYGVIVITRQVIEPKIMGKNIGLHPLAILMSIYLGMRIFGMIGIFIGPLTLIIVKALQKTMVLPKWKERKSP